MTSRHLLWTRWVQQNKRYLWLYAINGIFLFCSGPLKLLNDIVGIVERKGIEGRNAVPKVAISSVSFDFKMLWLFVLFGVFGGIYGFSYLHYKKKVDFYHSQPMSDGKRFLNTYISGLFCCYIPFVITFCLNLVIVKGYGAFSVEFLQELIANTLLQMLVYFAAYQVAVLMTILTGNVIYSILMTGTAFLYELLVRKVIVEFSGVFFQNYPDRANTVQCKWSPVWAILQETGEWAWLDSNKEVWENAGSTLVCGFVISIIIGVVAYLVYKKRPAEYTGPSLAFKKLRSVVKVVITVIVVCIFLDMHFQEQNDYQYIRADQNLVGTTFGMILIGIIICHIIFEFLWELDIRQVRKHFVSTLLAGGVTFLLFCSFYYDWYGYDTYVPDAEKVESVGVVVNDYYYDDSDEECVDNVKLSCVDVACNLAKELSTEKNTWEYYIDDNQDIIFVDFAFHMKNGNTCYRTYTTYIKKGEAPLPEITNTEEYKRAVYPFIYENDNIEKITEQVEDSLYWMDKSGKRIGITDYSKEELEKLQQALQADVKEYSYNTPYIFQHENTAIGRLTVKYPTDSGDPYSTEYLVFPEYTRTMECLKEMGITTDSTRGFDLEDIEEMKILEWEHESHNKSITDLEQQKEVLSLVRNDWQPYGNNSNNATYEIEVRFKDGNVSYYYFNGKELPDWITDLVTK